MSDRVAILLKAFPDIPIWEWLEELATRELTKEHTNSTVHIKKRREYRGRLSMYPLWARRHTYGNCAPSHNDSR